MNRNSTEPPSSSSSSSTPKLPDENEGDDEDEDERVGSWAGETNKDGPPLPNLLLHPMEEKEKSGSLMQP